MTRHCTPHLNGKNSFTIFNWNFLPKINVKDKLKASPNFLANYNWLYYSKSTGKKCSAPLLFLCRFSVLVRKKADREVFVVLSIVSLSYLPILGNPVPIFSKGDLKILNNELNCLAKFQFQADLNFSLLLIFGVSILVWSVAGII